MCGIVGFWSKRERAEQALVERMAASIASRGPDSFGAWTDDHTGLALGHRRLAIVDLSSAGHQPMVSENGRLLLTFNGEIYNHADIRRELDEAGGGVSWNGHSDTETLLAAIQKWGIEGALTRANGMFAFGCWDRSEQVLYLARDRMGEKPLYYGRCGTTFFFGSDLKSFQPHPHWRPVIDRDALASYMRLSYVPDPRSIYSGIHKLPPAHFVAIRNAGEGVTVPRCYWDLAQVAQQGLAGTIRDEGELIDLLDGKLREAVRSRMMADVPLGAFLSGGYDSSLVVALMQAQSTRPIKTFTIGFHENAFNEAQHARKVAEHLGTQHTEMYVSQNDVVNLVPDLPSIWSEPFADSSQLPTFLLCKLARQHVTVSLSGDGGDELFAGYSRYAFADIWEKLKAVPRPVRRAAAWALARAPMRTIEAMQGALPAKFRVSHLADRLPKVGEMLVGSDGLDFYHSMISHWKKPNEVVIGSSEPNVFEERTSGLKDLEGARGLRDRMMFADMMTYLPGDILTKVDRASMAVSLEARVPLLDHRLVEFAWRIPGEFKVRQGQGKWPLRQVLYRYVPKTLMERPKMGFGVPIEKWLIGPLRDWAEDLLSESRLKGEGYFNPDPIRKKWLEHVSGRRRWHYYLWDVLMFQQWLQSSR